MDFRSHRVRTRLRACVDVLEARSMLSVTAPAGALLTGASIASTAAAKPLIVKLKSASTALKKVALATKFTALDALKAPAASTLATIDPTRFTAFGLDLAGLKSTLAAAPIAAKRADGLVVALPAPDGSLKRFKIWQSSIMGGTLAAQTASTIRTFSGIGVDDPTQNVVLDYTTQGLHASVLGPGGDWYVDPYYPRDASQYASYFKSDLRNTTSWVCETDDLAIDVGGSLGSTSLTSDASLVSGADLRTYDLAMATTAEYTAYQGGAANALSAVVSTVVRLNQVYERDLGIHLNLVGNESSLIFTSATDPFTTPDDADATNAQLQTKLDAVIGSANYDLGHVLHKCPPDGDNGLAGGIGTVGTAGIKGEGYSAAEAPSVDPFTIDYVAHEIGHQFGGRHVFSRQQGSLGDDAALAVEPGSGTTIMSYAGIGSASENIQAHSDAMFNSINFEQITAYITSAPRGATLTNTGNAQPTVAVSGRTTYAIPVSTPFALTAIGNDADAGDVLTYSWEQRNGSGSVFATPSATRTTGPAFRPYLPTTLPTRIFPTLNTVLNGGTSNVGETLPSVARSMSFTVMVRDNHAGGGKAATLSSLVTVTTVTGGAFAITSLNSGTLAGGSNQTLTWNVGASTSAAVAATAVNILLSTDGGNTFPITLASNVANDGSETIRMPYSLGTSSARIKIQPTNNIFFDINNANLTITNVAPPASTAPLTPQLVPDYDTGRYQDDGVTQLNNATTETRLQFRVDGTTARALVEVLSDGTVIGHQTATGASTFVTTDITTIILADGQRQITARQTETGKSVSPNSSARTITVDTQSPTVTPLADRFGFETGHTLSYAFSELTSASSAFDLASLTVTSNGLTSTPASVSVAEDGRSLVATFNTLPDGNYTATLAAGAVKDLAGNALATADTTTFFVLAGDGNRDRVVNFSDLTILAQNYNLTRRTFSQGNFDYSPDGAVNFGDLTVLAQQYNLSVAAAASMAGIALPPSVVAPVAAQVAKKKSVASGVLV